MFEHVKVRTCFDPISFKLMTVGPGKPSVDYWEDVGVKFSVIWKLELDIWLLYDLLCRVLGFSDFDSESQ